jgi:imidazole glycerol-phosphate synthase subunit HisH
LIAIVDYGVGNLRSVQNMFKRVGASALITNDPEQITSATGLLLPGVGHFSTCMERFSESGLRGVVEKQSTGRKIPILGICVGAQMMTKSSEEGNSAGLGWIPANTVKFKLDTTAHLKVPHMGWSDLIQHQSSPLWDELPVEPRFYFAHSYHFLFDDEEFVIGKARYGHDFACAFQKENVFGVQFHPEKSHRFGMKVFENFVKKVAV